MSLADLFDLILILAELNQFFLLVQEYSSIWRHTSPDRSRRALPADDLAEFVRAPDGP